LLGLIQSLVAQEPPDETIQEPPDETIQEPPDETIQEPDIVIEQLRKHLSLLTIDHTTRIMNERSLHDAHVYCIINNLNAQTYGPLLEKYIITKFGFTKNLSKDCVGDCCKNGINYEIKISFGGKTHTKFNFVQFRPYHMCTYVLLVFYLSELNLNTHGKLYIFKVPHTDLKPIILNYGGYAHGTIKQHGQITIESLSDINNLKEYSIRPSLNDECWKKLQPFLISETDL
jgi:hypothetical protein